MRPLLLHASSEVSVPTHRRVIHLEYATCPLADGLEWLKLKTNTIIADGFGWAAFPCLFCQGNLFRGYGLAMDITVALVILPLEDARRDFGAETAIDAG